MIGNGAFLSEVCVLRNPIEDLRRKRGGQSGCTKEEKGQLSDQDRVRLAKRQESTDRTRNQAKGKSAKAFHFREIEALR